MKALLAVLGTSFAVNVVQTNLQIACHGENASESHRFKRAFFDIPSFPSPMCMNEKGKICRTLRTILLNSLYYRVVTLIQPVFDFDNIVETYRSPDTRHDREVLDISPLMGFTKHAFDPRIEPGRTKEIGVSC